MPEKKRSLRKRKETEDTDDSDEEQQQEVKAKLEETRLLQKYRKRSTGLEASTLAMNSASAAGSQAAAQEEDGDGLLESYVKEKVQEGGEVDPQMEKYIAEQMAKRLGKAPGSAELDTGQDRNRSVDEDLYAIPDALKGQQTRQPNVSGWMAGILEVQLPVEYKLRNIEETEAAKKRLLASSRGAAEVEEEDEAGGVQQDGVIPRIAYPFDFGRQNPKLMPSAEQLANSKTKRNWKEKKKSQY